MINLAEGKMSLDGIEWKQITSWETWFMTPYGILNNLGNAVRACKGRDLDPDMTIIPVTVAISELGPEIIRR